MSHSWRFIEFWLQYSIFVCDNCGYKHLSQGDPDPEWKIPGSKQEGGFEDATCEVRQVILVTNS